MLERVRSPSAVGVEVKVTAPARIDLAGGWTDTPPICYDFGGKVCGVAIAIDGEVSIEEN